MSEVNNQRELKRIIREISKRRSEEGDHPLRGSSAIREWISPEYLVRIHSQEESMTRVIEGAYQMYRDEQILNTIPH